MTANNEKIAVIATRLPYVDRRALSEAWFSALHLASDGPLAPKPPERRAAATLPARGRPQPGASAAGRDTALGDARVKMLAPERAGRPSTGLDAPHASSRRTAVARETFARARSYAPFRTSLTFGVDGERVALLLRRQGGTLHVVALCRPEVAEIVRRALASADLHLRARGEAICASVETVERGVVA
jgi:hypothetical protein